MNKFRKIIERKINIQMGSLEKQDGSITDPGKETIKHLAATHFSQAAELKKTTYNNKVITKDEVYACLLYTSDAADE